MLQAASLEAGGVDAVLRRVVTGQVVDVDADRLGHLGGKGPVACDLKLRIVAMQRFNVVSNVLAEGPAHLLQEFAVSRFTRPARNVASTGGSLVSAERLVFCWSGFPSAVTAAQSGRCRATSRSMTPE